MNAFSVKFFYVRHFNKGIQSWYININIYIYIYIYIYMCVCVFISYIVLGYISNKHIVHNWVFTTKLFDKKDDYPSYTNCVSYLDSSTLCKIFHALIGSEFSHIARTTSPLITRINTYYVQANEFTSIISLLKKVFHKLAGTSDDKLIKFFSF